ncbi:MAG: universal stress protein [Caldilineaceae bacterium]|nr:universal stress protein [Caldilineaceae bacterium]
MLEVEPVGNQFNNALQEFRRARLLGDLEQLRARLTGRTAELLSYEDVRRMLHAGSAVGKRELRDVPLSAIVGSVGRYKDFTRNFLPLQDGTASRWANLQMRASGLAGFPPIEVYQVGDAYFVHDGNHRVSVARQMGADHIEAYVTRFESKVPLSPDDDLDDLIIKAEYADFLALTRLDQSRPDHDLLVTTPGRYPLITAQIEAHRERLSEESGRKISIPEATTHWYDTVYLPTVQVIRDRGMLRDFPNRTQADLYAWIHKYREELIDALGWEVDPETVAIDLPQRFSPRADRRIARLGERLRSVFTPNLLESGPAPGEWRRTRMAGSAETRLFRNILVPIGLQESDWAALDQALVIARREGSTLHGLHIVRNERAAESPRVRRWRDRFQETCNAANVLGEMAVVVASTDMSSIMGIISERARWVDLVAIRVDRPPGAQPLARLGSSISMLLRRCPRPVLTVPEHHYPIERAILAYDGSPKADEALYVCAYLTGRWQLPLTVVSVLEGNSVDDETVARAKTQLAQYEVDADFVCERGEVASILLEVAARGNCDLFVMGGYGFSPLLEVVLGSTVDEILRTAATPVLVCR